MTSEMIMTLMMSMKKVNTIIGIVTPVDTVAAGNLILGCNVRSVLQLCLVNIIRIEIT